MFGRIIFGAIELITYFCYQEYFSPCNRFFSNVPIQASFCLFSSFSHYNFNNTNWKKHRWCAWESNPRPKDGKRRQYHGAMAAANSYDRFLCKDSKIWRDKRNIILLIIGKPHFYYFKVFESNREYLLLYLSIKNYFLIRFRQSSMWPNSWYRLIQGN